MSTSLARTNFITHTPPHEEISTPTTPDEGEKQLFPSSSGSATSLNKEASSPTEELDVDFTPEEEARVRWKLDLTVLPLVFIGFYVFQLERGNVSNALTDGFLADVGITQDQFNTGQSLLFLGIILLEIPSNYVLQWLGPQIWISFQVLAFGLVATFQAFQKGQSQFLLTRILLGISECGYIPGALYLISTFYKRDELAKRNAFFFLGSGLASATSGLLAYGILPLGKLYPSLKGWQYLMIIEGCMAIFVSFLFLALLPKSPQSPTPMFLKFQYFNPREREILVARVVQDDRAKAIVAKKLAVKDIVGALKDWRKYPHVVIAISLIAQTSAISTYGPSVIKSFNFDTLTANALSSVSGWIGLVVIFSMGFISDKTRTRGLTVIGGVSILLIWWIAFQQKSLSTNQWLKYGLIVLVIGFGQAYHPVNATWLSLNCKTPQERSVAMAMFIMAANSGGLVGSQLLRGDDAPLYRRGFVVCVALTGFGLFVAILQHLQYRWSNWRLDKAVEGDEETLERQGNRRSWRYTT